MTRDHNISLVSFFAGSGLLDLGFEAVGYKVVHVNEYDPEFLDSYKHVRNKFKIAEPKYGFHLGSIRSYLFSKQSKLLKSIVQTERRQGQVVGFIGGSPCPDFSSSGQNAGRKGKNGSLSSTYVTLICKHRPDFFVFENVKGLFQTRKHRIFLEHLKRRLANSDYHLEMEIVNALEYGVPQHRERLILVGFHKSFLKRRNLDGADRLLDWQRYKKYSLEQVRERNWPKKARFRPKTKVPCPKAVIKDLTVQHWFEKNRVSAHPNGANYFNPIKIEKFRTLEEGNLAGKSFKRLHRWRYSPAACYGNNEVHLHPYEPRRISVAECMAIQSLPRKFSLPEEMPLSKMFKTLGNGVPYLASKGIARTISHTIKSSE